MISILYYLFVNLFRHAKKFRLSLIQAIQTYAPIQQQLQDKINVNNKIYSYYNYNKLMFIPQFPQTMREDLVWLNYQQRNSKKTNKNIKQPITQAVNAQKVGKDEERMRSKTENADDFQKIHSKKSLKSERQFSQQYLLLVNKLKVNLSKQQFEKKHSKKLIIKEKSHFYNQKGNSHSYSSNRQMNYMRQQAFSQPKEKKVLVRYEFGIRSQKENKNKDIYKLNLGNLRLSSQKKPPKTLDKRIEYFQKKQSLDQQSYRIDHQKPALNEKTETKKFFCQKLKIIKQQRKKIKLKPIKLQHQDINLIESSEINVKFLKTEELCFHVEILFDIYDMLNSSQFTQVILINLSNNLKRYILGHKKIVDQQQRLIVDDLTHMEQIYLQKQNQQKMRNLIMLQRLLIIFSIDLIANSNFTNYRTEVKQILQSIMGLYIYLLYVLKECKAKLPLHSQYTLAAINQKCMKNNIHLKRQTATLNQFIYKKLVPIMKTNLVLMEQIKMLFAQFQRRNVGNNRAFYQLLKIYAIYLNNNEVLIQRNYNLLKTFATCPSPYLTKPTIKKYTLVLDLDQTLIRSQNHLEKLQIFMRPFVRQFLTLMAKQFQIVIFTSSLPHYSEDIINQLPGIDYQLYRYHTTRIKNKYIKDLNRLGRPLDKVIIVDNDEESFALQYQNGIKISQWLGEDSTDQQLNVLALFLSNLVENNVQDVRLFVKNYKQFRKKYH